MVWIYYCKDFYNPNNYCVHKEPSGVCNFCHSCEDQVRTPVKKEESAVKKNE
jgi:hypothetical protein